MDVIITGTKVYSVSIGGGHRKLTSDFVFFYKHKKYVIPRGFIWDGASIPRFGWAIYGHPFDDVHEIPGLIHDAIYSGLFGRDFTRLEADRLYRILLRQNGCGYWQATKEYYAVRWFGKSHFSAEHPQH